MDLKLKVSGASKDNKNVILVVGTAGSGDAVATTIVRKGNNAVLQVVPGKKHPQSFGENFRIDNFTGSVVLVDAFKDKEPKEFSFSGVEADLAYIEKSNASKNEELESSRRATEEMKGLLSDTLTQVEKSASESAEDKKKIAELQAQVDELKKLQEEVASLKAAQTAPAKTQKKSTKTPAKQEGEEEEGK